MIHTPFPKKRSNSRAEVNWPVTVISKQMVIQGRAKNISRGGALLYLQERITLHENIRIAVEIPKYNYVISTIAKVVTTSPQKKENDHFAYTVGVEFNDMSNEDLKYFTGNLAPEWHQDYQEPPISSRSKNVFTKQIFYGLSAALVFSLLFFSIQAYKSDKAYPSQITKLESRLESLESQLVVLQEVAAVNKNVAEQLLNVENELSEIKNNNLATSTKAEQLQAQISDNQEKITDIALAAEDLFIAAKTDSGKQKTLQLNSVYHIVKRGENLFRIALKYGRDINEIRELNNLSTNYSIQPDQKLLIQ